MHNSLLRWYIRRKTRLSGAFTPGWLVRNDGGHLERRANCINSPLSTQKRNSALALSSIHVEQRHIAVPICGLPLNAEYSSGPTWHKKDLGVELCRIDVSGRYDAYRRVSELDDFRKITGWHANLERHVRVWNCVNNRLAKSVIRSQTFSAMYFSINRRSNMYVGFSSAKDWTENLKNFCNASSLSILNPLAIASN